MRPDKEALEYAQKQDSDLKGASKKHSKADHIDRSIDRQITKLQKKMAAIGNKRIKARELLNIQSQSTLSGGTFKD